jgi:hypothetical protein
MSALAVPPTVTHKPVSKAGAKPGAKKAAAKLAAKPVAKAAAKKAAPAAAAVAAPPPAAASPAPGPGPAAAASAAPKLLLPGDLIRQRLAAVRQRRKELKEKLLAKKADYESREFRRKFQAKMRAKANDLALQLGVFTDNSRKVVSQTTQSLGMLEFLLNKGADDTLSEVQKAVVRTEQKRAYEAIKVFFTDDPERPRQYLDFLVEKKALTEDQAARIKSEFHGSFEDWDALPWESRAATICDISGWTERGLEIFAQQAFQNSWFGWGLQTVVNFSDVAILSAVGATSGSWASLALTIALTNVPLAYRLISTTLGLMSMTASTWNNAIQTTCQTFGIIGKWVPGLGFLKKKSDSLSKASQDHVDKWDGFLYDKSVVEGNTQKSVIFGLINAIATFPAEAFKAVASTASSLIKNHTALLVTAASITLMLLCISVMPATFIFWPMVASSVATFASYVLGGVFTPAVMTGAASVILNPYVGVPAILLTAVVMPFSPVFITLGALATLGVTYTDLGPKIAGSIAVDIVSPFLQQVFFRTVINLAQTVTMCGLSMLRSGLTSVLIATARRYPKSAVARRAVQFLQRHGKYVDAILYLALAVAVFYYAAPLLVYYKAIMKHVSPPVAPSLFPTTAALLKESMDTVSVQKTVSSLVPTVSSLQQILETITPSV